MGNVMATNTSSEKCSRCNAQGHMAVDCPNKSFMKPMCAYCKRLGHVDGTDQSCPARRKEVNRAAYNASLFCFHCDGHGHIKRNCPSKDLPKCFECKEVGHKGADCVLRRARLDADKSCFSILSPEIPCHKIGDIS